VLRAALIRLSQQGQLRNIAMHNGLAHSFALRFVAGETLEQAIPCIRELNARGMSATLDHLGENVSSREEAAEAADAYRRILQEVSRAGVRCNVSLKLTHMGLDLGREVAFENTRRVVEEAAHFDNFIRIDMESSNYVDRTLELFHRLFDEHKNVGVVIQSALHRSESDLEQLIKVAARVRLVKGAYLEPRSVAFQRKSDVDANFVRLMEMLLARGAYPAIATHDVNLIEAGKRFAQMQGIASSRFEFQMLFGIRRDLQAQLVREGYNMRIYVPYGTAWYPYLMRRMAERPANLMFVLGNLAREAVAKRPRAAGLGRR
jgi:proline dehydrogenase